MHVLPCLTASFSAVLFSVSLFSRSAYTLGVGAAGARRTSRVQGFLRPFVGSPKPSFQFRGNSPFLTRTLASVSAPPPVEEKPKEKMAVEKFRKDYKKPEWDVESIDLKFDLREQGTIVETEMILKKSAAYGGGPLVFDGEDLKLLTLEVDGKAIPISTMTISDDSLTIPAEFLPSGTDSFSVKTMVEISPEKNEQLSGLYKSGGIFCTQCEAEGFRRITYFFDRPDVMTKYSVYLSADKKAYPILLSNGNKIEDGDVPDDTSRHYAKYVDPFKKPAYLFALVAGDLGSITDEFVTSSGKTVKLALFSEHENIGKLQWAMESLKKAMKWDEDTFGLEYDLDIFNVVAVKDFNMGAMENKSLNVFNTACLLASTQTSSDADFERVEGVVAHEYFHNWTGNRVTCQDWFQLTLKEGLTVYRDSIFSADMGSAAVKRIEDVKILRRAQFAEDAGPMAHPIRPESYIAMDNFYTATVYIKGCEVVRMYRTLLGVPGFRKGMDLYFQRHDGQAVACDDFRAAMADANGVDLSQFERWYLNAGTPTVEVVSVQHDAGKGTLTLKLKQSQPDTPSQPGSSKLPLLIPVKIGVLSKASGKEVVAEQVLKFTEAEQEFVIEGVGSDPVVPSILRDFSAPVKLKFEQSDEDLAFLMAHDVDAFVKFEAGQKILTKEVLRLAESVSKDPNAPLSLSASVESAVKTILKAALDPKVDKSLTTYTLRVPDLPTLAMEVDVVDPDALKAAADFVRDSIATKCTDDLTNIVKTISAALKGKKHEICVEDVGARRLRGLCLAFLACRKDADTIGMCKELLDKAECMSDRMAAMGALSCSGGPEWDAALESFYTFAAGDPLVTDKWFALQASADLPDTLERVERLMEHKDFTMKNPNRLRNVVSVLGQNLPHFHNKNGKGYDIVKKCVEEVDKFNPQMAARLANLFSQWKRYGPERQTMMKARLQALADGGSLSKDTLEIVTKSLK